MTGRDHLMMTAANALDSVDAAALDDAGKIRYAQAVVSLDLVVRLEDLRATVEILDRTLTELVRQTGEGNQR